MNSLFLAKILRRIPNGVRTLLVLACLSVTPTLHAQLFSDNFNAGLNARWQTNSGTPGVWSIVANELNGGPNSGVNYGYIYIATNTWTNYSISAKIRFSAATVWGGGIGGRLDATTGAHYAAWIYPESSPAGASAICRLFRFSGWTSFAQIGSDISLPGVGNTNHTVRLDFQTNQIRFYYDGAQLASATDATYANGGITAEMWTQPADAVMAVDDVVVSAISSVPVANNDSFSVVTGTPSSMAAPGVLANDTGGVGPLTAVLVSGAARGPVSLSSNGSFTYTATNNYTGTDSFTYRANDGVTNSQTATVTITVTSNTPPVANNDSYNVISNTVLTISAPGVLANDTDVNAGQTLTAIKSSNPTNGSVTLNSNGSFSYTPNANYTGPDAFTYRTSDGSSTSSVAVVTIDVTFISGSFADSFGHTGTLTPWLTNNSVHWTVTNGTLNAGPDVTAGDYGFAYITNVFTNYFVEAKLRFPAGGFGGGMGGRLQSTASGAHYSAWIYPENASGLSNVLRLIKFSSWGNFTQMGSDVLLASVGTNFHTVRMAFHNSQIAVYVDGVRRLTASDPDPLYSYGGITAEMWTPGGTPYVMSFDDYVVNELALSDNYTMNEDTTLNVGAASGVLTNDTAVYTTSLTASLVSGPANGTLNLNSDGSFSYTPATNFSGPITFVYRAVDGGTNLDTGTVTITVNPVNDPPILQTQVNRTNAELTSISITNTATDVDVPAQTLTYTLAVTNIANNTQMAGATINSQGVISWTPTEAQGPSTNLVTTRVSDGSASATNTFTLYITEVNVAPQLPAQTNRFAGKNLLMTVTNTASDTDLPANTLTYTLAVTNTLTGAQVTGPSISAQGVITWTPTAPQDPSTNLFMTRVTDSGSPNLSATNTFTVIVNSQPVIGLDTSTLVSESCLPTNNAVDNGETVTINFALENIGYGDTTNLVVTLLQTNGVMAPSGAQVYGALLAGGAAVSRSFSFSAAGSCGSNITATLQMQDGSLDLGTMSVPFQLGTIGTILTQNFDSVTAPALPAGWTAQSGGIGNVATNWYTTNTLSDTTPNAVFSRNPANVSSNILFSPVLTLPPSGTSQLTFRQRYDMEDDASNQSLGYDGGVLEIKINAGPWQDITNAGGTFVSGGYNRIIDTGFGSPLAGRPAWSGTSNSYYTVLVNLPPTAAGQNVQLRWFFASDNGQGAGGWRIDSIGVKGQICCANSPPILANQTNRTVSELVLMTVTNTVIDPGSPNTGLIYTLAVTNVGNNTVVNNASISASGVITWTPTEVQGPSTNLFTTVVFNTVVPSLAATNSFTVIVNDVNSAPILPTINAQTVPELGTLIVTNTATDTDIPPNTLSYSLINPPANASISAQGVITFTPNEAQGPSTNTITTVCTDGTLSTTNSFTVTVTEVNTPPGLPSISQRTIVELTTLIVTNTASDGDIPANTLVYNLLNPPANVGINAQGIITFTPSEAQGPSTNTIVTVVSDGVASATNSFVVIVTETNSPPLLPAITNQTVAELSTLSVTNTATDSDLPANTLTYTLQSPPANVSIDAQGVITFTPGEAQGPSTNTITTVVSDGTASATNSFTVVVTEVNSPPSLPVIGDQTVAELSTLTVTNTASDSDVPANTLSYTLLSPPANASISSQGVVTFTPSEAQGPSTNTITTVVSDGSASATNSFFVIVTEVNSPPSLPVISQQTVAELATMIVTNAATDSDLPANTLSYSLANPPANVSIDAQGVITFTPNEAQGPSTNTITTIVSDGSASATNSFTVIVTEVNTPPSLGTIGQQTIAELSTLIVTNTATDSDVPANTLTYSLLNPPANASISSQGVVTFTPSEAQGPSTNTITTVVSDGTANATNSFTVVVTEVNEPPTLPVIGQQTIAELSTLVVTNTATDPDVPANTLTYSLLDPPANANINSQGIITFTPNTSQGPSTNTITTVVSDGTASATNSFTVIVTDQNTPPILPVISDQTIAELNTLTVTNTATDADVPTNTLTYTLINPPANASIDSHGVITFSPSEAQGPSTNIIKTVVSDGQATATNTFTVFVTEVNSTPSLPVVSDRIIAELTTLTVTNVATDSDLPANTLTYSLLSPPANASISAQGVITFTPSEAQGPSTNTITTIVSDGSASATNSFTVLVTEVNTAPSLPVVGQKSVVELSTLTVTNTATDADLPANTLSYSLAATNIATGLPITNANISAAGVITWTPATGQGPSTNQFITIVSDNGSPNLHATNSFIVVVLTTEPEPQFIITSITISNDVAIVKWNSTTGETYRLRHKENVVDLNWTTSSPDITATGSTASANDVFGNSPMRFYQVEHVAPTNGPAPGTVNFDTAPAPGDSDAAPASGSSGVSNAQNVESYATATAQRFYRSGFAP